MHGSMDEHETTFKQTRHQTLEFYFFCFSNSLALPEHFHFNKETCYTIYWSVVLTKNQLINLNDYAKITAIMRANNKTDIMIINRTNN